MFIGVSCSSFRSIPHYALLFRADKIWRRLKQLVICDQAHDGTDPPLLYILTCSQTGLSRTMSQFETIASYMQRENKWSHERKSVIIV